MNRNTSEITEDGEVIEGEVTTVAVEQAREQGLWTSLAQLAQQQPRDWGQVIRSATKMVTVDEDTAIKCHYAFERGGKMIVGPSITLAKAIQAAAGRIAIRVRGSHETASTVVVDVAALDLCNLNYVEVQVSRKILDKNGRRFNEDMINVTRAAAASIGHRNGVLRLVPDFVIDTVYDAAHACAVGDIQSIASKRAVSLDKLHKAGVTDDMILRFLNLQTTEQIMGDELIVLRTAFKQMREDGKTPEQAFAAPGTMAAADEAKAAEARIRGAANGKPEPTVMQATVAKANEVEKAEKPAEPTPEEKAAIEAREKAEARAETAEPLGTSGSSPAPAGNTPQKPWANRKGRS